MFALLLVNVVGSLGIFALAVKIGKRTEDFLGPPQGFAVIWVVGLLVSQLGPQPEFAPQLDTVVLAYSAAFVLLLSYAVGTGSERGQGGAIELNKRPALIVLFVLILLQAAAVQSDLLTYGLSSLGDLGAILAAYPSLRLQGVFTTSDLPWYLETMRWSFVWYIPLLLSLKREKMISAKLVAIVLVFASVSAILKMTRAPLFQLTVTCLASWTLLFRPSPKIKATIAMLGLCVVICAFLVTQASLLLNDQNARLTLSESTFVYFGSSFRAYDGLLHGQYPDLRQGLYSVDWANFALYKLGLLNSYPGLERPYSYVPMATNMYTYLDCFTLDLGFPGAILGSAVLGLLVSTFRKRAHTNPNIVSLIVYSHLFYCLVMSPAGNEFIRFSVILYPGIAWLIYLVVRKTDDSRVHHGRSSQGQVVFLDHGTEHHFADEAEVSYRLSV